MSFPQCQEVEVGKFPWYHAQNKTNSNHLWWKVGKIKGGQIQSSGGGMGYEWKIKDGKNPDQV